MQIFLMLCPKCEEFFEMEHNGELLSDNIIINKCPYKYKHSLNTLSARKF